MFTGLSDTGACGIRDSIVGNGLGYLSSNSERGCLHSYSTNTFGKSMNPTISQQLPAKGKY